jgi:hypothetical protein
VKDPQKQAIFERLRDLWITLANERSLMTESELSTQFEAISRIQDDMIGEERTVLPH